MPVLSHADYARHRNVASNAVSNYIARGQLTAPALQPDGRIDRDLADEQLAETLDTDKATAARNRAGTARNVERATGAVAALQQARAVSATVAAERDRRKLNLERGRYVLAAQQLEVTARLMTEFVSGVEQSFEDLAETAQLTRAQLAGVRKWWRELRQKTADKLGADAEAFPEFVEDNAA